jgi:MFS family permease
MPATSDRNVTGSKTALVVTVCLAQFMVVLDATVTNVALPTIARDLRFTPGDL